MSEYIETMQEMALLVAQSCITLHAQQKKILRLLEENISNQNELLRSFAQPKQPKKINLV